ncbi:MAG TPA: glycoside hydrolase family 44 protein [Terracidiphilus sp.]|nr:glycoside hydrolase family 44 protein [Terracidiphilus sp.]
MNPFRWHQAAQALLVLTASSTLILVGCSGGSSVNNNPPPVTTYTLTVASTNPTSGVAITVAPSDNNGSANGNTSFTRTYNSGTAITLTAASTSGGNKFSSWTGCTSASTTTCSVTLSTNATVTANYTVAAVTSVTVTPNPAAATIGSTLQFSAAVSGPNITDNSVTWSVAASGTSLSPGDISSSGLYTTPYPAPASVTVTVTSNQDSTVSGSVTVTLSAPAVAGGPSLTVDAGNVTHAIDPLIYGMNAFQLVSTAAAKANITIDRWGGDATSRYNYKLDATSSASDWYFENHLSGNGQQDNGFDTQVQADQAIGAKTIGTVPVLGWVAKDGTSCSFPKTTYPSQVAFDPYGGACGDGLYPQGVSGCNSAGGCNITGVAATDTSTAVTPSWAGDWVTYLVGKFGSAANGGVAIYDLDNEPAWWDAVHRDVHPLPSTYDEVTNNGIATALAIKTADPTADVSGPVVDYWWNYFYSKKDIENGWGSGSPCWQPWSNPVDRNAHGGIPFIEYYLQQFKTAETQHGMRLLDYLDLHTYFVASYNGASLGFATAGDTGAQQARLNSTRVFWDPTYTDPNYPQPNYITDTNYTSSCKVPLQAPQLIPMMHNWVNADYPGTKLAITEYNWGGQESVNGALAQADILGIFGREGLDIGTLWGAPDPTTQIPGLMAFEIYRNYDGAKSTFGNQALASTSADQGKLSVYGALRTSDNTLTIVVINKTYGDLTSTLTLANFTPAGNARVYLYSNANLSAIASQPDITVTPPAGGGTDSSVTTTFPAQSITLLAVPKQ